MVIKVIIDCEELLRNLSRYTVSETTRGEIEVHGIDSLTAAIEEALNSHPAVVSYQVEDETAVFGRVAAAAG